MDDVHPCLKCSNHLENLPEGVTEMLMERLRPGQVLDVQIGLCSSCSLRD